MRWLLFIVWLSGTLLPLWAYFDTRMPRGHLAEFHSIRTLLVAESWRAGEIIPRWSPELCMGLGSPLFIFYGWFPYAVAAGVKLLLSVEAVTATNIATILFALTQGAGAWFLGRELGGRRGAWVFWALYTLAPYVLVNLYVRVNYPEYCAGALVPWALLFMIRTVRSGRIADGMGAALVLSIILFTHNLSALMINPLVGVVGLLLALQKSAGGRKAAVGRVVLVLLSALFLGAHFWVPLVAHHGDAQLSRVFTDYFDFRNHFIYPSQLFSLAWQYGSSEPGTADTMPLQLGLTLWLALGGAVYVAGRRGLPLRGRSRTAALFAAVTLLIVFFSTTLSAPLWEVIRPLQLLHFPWLLLLPASLTAAACGAVAAPVLLPSGRGRRWNAVVPALLLGAFSFAYCRPSEWLSYSDARFREILEITYCTTAVADEYRPSTSRSPSAGQTILDSRKFWLNGSPLAEVPVPEPSLRRSVSVDLPTTHPGGMLIAPVFYFPGWQAKADGKEVETFPGETHGFLTVKVPPGTRHLTIRRQEGILLRGSVLVSCLALIATPWIFRRSGLWKPRVQAR